MSVPSAPPSPVRPIGRVFAFRASLVFFGLISLPLNPDYWRAVFAADWTRFHFQDFFQLAEWSPRFLPANLVPEWGLASFGHLGAALLAALVAAGVWTGRAPRDAEHERLGYWVRVLVRYRLAVALIGYGVIKLIPLQFPEPTLSELHTPYGSFLPWKIYYLTNGVAVAGYQSMLGAVEIVAALLLLERRTATIGAGLAAGVLINVVLVNFAYDLGDHVYATYLLLLAAFLLAHDTPRLYQLLVRERPARAERFDPVFTRGQARLRRIGRGLLAAWAIVFGALAYAGYRNDPGFFPAAAGLPGAEGFYRVTGFVRDGVAHPPAPTDPVRWRNVVFEPWNTLSVESGRPAEIDFSSSRIAAAPDAGRNYEQAGNGGRHYFSYAFDAEAGSIELIDKNRPHERYAFRYRQDADGRIELTGTGPGGETLRIDLERVEKRYLLREGRRRPISIQ